MGHVELLSMQLSVGEPVVEHIINELCARELAGLRPDRLKRTCIKTARGEGTAFLPPRWGW